jgi:hypothetical protein
MFDIKKFEERFEQAIVQLEGAEKITKETLRELSRSVLEALHAGDKPDIRFVNRLLSVLTPVNKKVSILYFQHFSGFYFNEKSQEFGKKDKTKDENGAMRYDRCKALSEAFIADPLNNIWVWADRNVKHEVKPTNYRGKIVSDIQKAMKADPKNNPEPLNEEDVIQAVFEAGITPQAIMRILAEMAKEEEGVE